MKKLQVTTTLGAGGLTAALTKFILLFEGMNINELFDKFGSTPIPAFLTAVGGVLLSLWAICHNEDKGEP